MTSKNAIKIAKKNNWNFQLLVLVHVSLCIISIKKQQKEKTVVKVQKTQKQKKGQKKKENYKKQSLCLFVGGWDFFLFESFWFFNPPPPLSASYFTETRGLRPCARFAASPRRSPLCRVVLTAKYYRRMLQSR